MENHKSDSFIKVFNPFNNKIISTIPNANKKQIKIAIESADNAFKLWSEFSSKD